MYAFVHVDQLNISSSSCFENKMLFVTINSVSGIDCSECDFFTVTYYQEFIIEERISNS